MAGLRATMMAAAVGRLEHIGEVLVPAAVLVQRRAERSERLRLAKAAAATIAGASEDLVEIQPTSS